MSTSQPDVRGDDSNSSNPLQTSAMLPPLHAEIFETPSAVEMVANLYLSLMEPPYPAKYFSDAEKAKAWLRTFPMNPLTPDNRNQPIKLPA